MVIDLKRSKGAESHLRSVYSLLDLNCALQFHTLYDSNSNDIANLLEVFKKVVLSV